MKDDGQYDPDRLSLLLTDKEWAEVNYALDFGLKQDRGGG